MKIVIIVTLLLAACVLPMANTACFAAQARAYASVLVIIPPFEEKTAADTRTDAARQTEDRLTLETDPELSGKE